MEHSIQRETDQKLIPLWTWEMLLLKLTKSLLPSPTTTSWFSSLLALITSFIKLTTTLTVGTRTKLTETTTSPSSKSSLIQTAWLLSVFSLFSLLRIHLSCNYLQQDRSLLLSQGSSLPLSLQSHIRFSWLRGLWSILHSKLLRLFKEGYLFPRLIDSVCYLIPVWVWLFSHSSFFS